MDSRQRQEIALFRYGVIAPLVTQQLTRLEYGRLLQELTRQEFVCVLSREIPQPPFLVDHKQFYGELGDDTYATIRSTDGTVKIKLQGSPLFGSARLTGFDNRGDLYVLVEDLYPNGDKLGVEMTARRYNQQGEMTGVVRLPGENFATVPNRPVEVTPEGKVYMMTPLTDGLSVYEVTMGKGYQSRVTQEKPQVEPAVGPIGGVSPAVFTTSFDRRGVRVRAINMNTQSWTWKSKYDWTTDGSARANINAPKPIQLASLTAGMNTTGIPYSWGGWDTPYTTSDDKQWTYWSGATGWAGTYGPLMGNAPPGSTGTWYRGSAGVDCAGYVAAASGVCWSCYGITTKPGAAYLGGAGYDFKGARTMYDSIWYLQPMNFLGNSDHVWYYEFRLRDGTGVSTFESTTTGNPQAGKRYKKTWAEAQGYSYHESWWAEGPGDGPDDARTTKGIFTGSDVVGSSVWYKFTVSGPTSVTLTGITNGDADLHVYSGVDPSLTAYGSSTNSGSTNESVSIGAAGTYYVRVHVLTDNGSSVSWTINW